jgi:hypothetical protein
MMGKRTTHAAYSARAARPKREKRRLRAGRIFFAGLVFAAVFGAAARFLAPEAPEAKALPNVGRAVSENVGIAAAEAGAPKEVSVRQIAEEVLSSWARALLTGDFGEFHGSLAGVWKSQDSPDKLAGVYGSLFGYRESLERFPGRGKLVLLESAPFDGRGSGENGILRENVGPESPWLVRGEWRTGNTALNFALVLTLDDRVWKPAGLRVEIYERRVSG